MKPRVRPRNGVRAGIIVAFVYAPRTRERNTQGTRTPRRREARRRSHNYAHPLELHSFIKVSEHGGEERERERRMPHPASLRLAFYERNAYSFSRPFLLLRVCRENDATEYLLCFYYAVC